MNHQLYHLDNNKLRPIPFNELEEGLKGDNYYWLHVKASDRAQLAEFMHKMEFQGQHLEHITNPETSLNILMSEDSISYNLVVPGANDIYSRSFISFLVKPKIFITLTEVDNHYFDSIYHDINNNFFQFDLDPYLLMYYMFNEVLKFNMNCVIGERKKVTQFNKALDKDEIEIEDILKLKHNLGELSSIMDDQYIAITSLPKLNWVSQTTELEKEFQNLNQGFINVQDSIDRLEQKVNNLHLHCQLMLQEKGNKRLNMLTIVQAIFVPLTLMTGVYGMNFVNMPELQYENGYFVFIGLMVLIVVVELIIFYKNGWFD